MKQNYEAPAAKLIGFAPMENIAASWDWSQSISTYGLGDSQVDVIYPNNPEGDF